MAYQTGSVTSASALASVFTTWLTGLGGWTINTTPGAPVLVDVTKSSRTFLMAFGTDNTLYAGAWDGITIYGANNTSGTGRPKSADTTANFVGAAGSGTGSFIYHFFASGDDIVIVMQRGAIFNYVSFGINLTKEGSWTGTGYCCTPLSAYDPINVLAGFDVADTIPPSPPFFSTRNFSAARKGGGLMASIAVDGLSETWYGSGTPSDGGSLRTARSIIGFAPGIEALYGDITIDRRNLPSGRLWIDSRSVLANNLLVHRAPAAIERSSGRFSVIGYHPTMAQVFSRGELADASTVTIGSDTWMVFGSYAVLKV